MRERLSKRSALGDALGMARFLVLATGLLLASCGGGAIATCDGSRSLVITDPVEGQTLDGARYTFVIETCGFARDEQVVLRILDPVPADYAFATLTTADQTVALDVPVLPGPLRFEATSRDGSVRSATLGVMGAPPE